MSHRDAFMITRTHLSLGVESPPGLVSKAPASPLSQIIWPTIQKRRPAKAIVRAWLTGLRSGF